MKKEKKKDLLSVRFCLFSHLLIKNLSSQGTLMKFKGKVVSDDFLMRFLEILMTVYPCWAIINIWLYVQSSLSIFDFSDKCLQNISFFVRAVVGCKYKLFPLRIWFRPYLKNCLFAVLQDAGFYRWLWKQSLK